MFNLHTLINKYQKSNLIIPVKVQLFSKVINFKNLSPTFNLIQKKKELKNEQKQ